MNEFTKGYSEDLRNVPIILTPEAFEAMKTINEKLIQSQVIGFLDFYYGESFIVTTEVSLVGLANLISQAQDGRERILGYGSRKLSEAKTKYHVCKLELLSIVKCLEKIHFFSIQNDTS